MLGIFANRKRESLVKLIGNYPWDHPELWPRQDGSRRYGIALVRNSSETGYPETERQQRSQGETSRARLAAPTAVAVPAMAKLQEK
jgi:hypothetical protein